MVRNISMGIIYVSCLLMGYFGIKMVAYFFGGQAVVVLIPVVIMAYLAYSLVKKKLESR